MMFNKKMNNMLPALGMAAAGAAVLGACLIGKKRNTPLKKMKKLVKKTAKALDCLMSDMQCMFN